VESMYVCQAQQMGSDISDGVSAILPSASSDGRRADGRHVLVGRWAWRSRRRECLWLWYVAAVYSFLCICMEAWRQPAAIYILLWSDSGGDVLIHHHGVYPALGSSSILAWLGHELCALWPVHICYVFLCS
jgi:hypothetical protein